MTVRLRGLVTDYLRVRRSLGYKLEYTERLLFGFVDYLSAVGAPRRSSHEQRLGVRDPRVQTRRQGPRLLAHPGHPAAALPDPFLPGQRPQPRTPAHRRHPRCPDRQPVDATPASMIHFP
jgi:hypothetical protein